MSRKEKEVFTRIITKFKEMAHLWYKYDKYYSNRAKREESYNILLEIYKEYDEMGTMHLLKKKLENMRTSYAREVKKVRASIVNGDRVIYEPTLWYFHMFHFLKKNERDIPASSSDQMENDGVNPEGQDSTSEDAETDSDDDEGSAEIVLTEIKREIPSPEPFGTQNPEPCGTQNPEPRGTQNPEPCGTQNIVKVEAKDSPQQSNENPSYLETQFRAITLQLQGLQGEQFIIANKLIADIMFYARLGLLTPESTIKQFGGHKYI